MSGKSEEFEWSRSRMRSNEPRIAEEPPAEEQSEPVDAPVEVAAALPPAPATTEASSVPTYARPQPVLLAQDNEDPETLIGVHSFFDGTLRCESSMRIKGTVEGEIKCTESLVIEETATVKAKVTAANATIAGRLEGSVICDGRLEVLATAKVSGDLTAGVLIMQEGAFFEGRLKVKDTKPHQPSKARSGFFRIFAPVAHALNLFSA